ncbi:unnamed protein product [Parascedosporium putredinis]|uniref:Isochorismatase-like domain-containing protein n=1 Tax=Parascedosporium putredinis TaxID=1442378 RepID=A0A9P1MGS6_9PEZI|nr:unnamed protein product [Parascedosporium putredinis]CAI8004996.1 unnamed protein product [Parascedosporium putredinis]
MVASKVASTKDSTLVIIDAQNEYAEGKLTVKNIASSRKVIHALLEKYRASGGNVVHVVHDTPRAPPSSHPAPSSPRSSRSSRPATAKSPAPRVDWKQKLVLVGYMAHVCISTTARSGARFGYDIVVVEDAVGDRDIPGADADQLVKVALAEIADAFGTIVQSSDIN